jgi:dUTP pyrophosphatase
MGRATEKTIIKFKLVEGAAFPEPNRAKPGDAGFDIVSVGAVHCPAKQVTVVDTPFIVADAPDLLPDGSDYYIKVNSRSGMAAKHGLFPITGTIDKGYRGQIKVVMYNAGAVDVLLNPGDRIAQLVVHKIAANDLGFEITDNITPTERGDSGFGSSGRQ